MVKSKIEKNKISIGKVLPYILIICSILGLIASFALTYDKIQVLKNTGYDPPCNINPIFSCGSVMKTEQASLFGVPNTIFGLMGFTALLTFGALMLSGAKFKKWIWQAAQIFATLGVIFMHYLFFQGVYRINAICPWCFLTWMITIPTFIFITTYNIEHNNIKLPDSFRNIGECVKSNYINILIGWYAIIIIILLEHFWYYWKTLI